jgi:hypothetical protein
MLTEVVRQDCCLSSQKIRLQKASEGVSASRTYTPTGPKIRAWRSRSSLMGSEMRIEIDIEISRGR